MTTLFEPLQAGALELPNRIIMAPLTRCRAEAGRVPGELMVEYYRQRAGAGLIISEATSVTPMGVGYPNTPGIWSAEQIAGWRQVTDAVHAAGGQIVLQLWHVGRISDPIYLDGERPVAPSAIPPAGHVSLIRPEKAYETPRALTAEEIPGIVDAYRQGALNAREAGFDGVEIHGANGYLLEQFLLDGSNQRTDAYGGSVENRARLLLEITDAAIDVWGADRVGVHLSPRADAHDVSVTDRTGTYSYVAQQLGQRRIAFICAREHAAEDSLGPQLKQLFGGVYIANEQFDRTLANQWISAGKADAIAFGKAWIANPDLEQRLRQDAPLNEPDGASFYGSGPEGYTDYPTLAETRD